MNTISLVSFVIATGAVAFFTFFIVSKMKKSDSATEEYFTGGRALAWPVVCWIFAFNKLIHRTISRVKRRRIWR